MPYPMSLLLEMPAGSILQFDKNMLINMGIQVVNIVILVVILAKFLYNPVRKFLDGRTERIKNEIDSARTARNEALELKEHYEQLIANIEQEREEVLHQAYKKAVEKSDQMLFDAKREAELVYDRALGELEEEKQSMLNDMKRQIIEISVMMAGRFVEVSMDRVSHDKYIDEALAEWEEG